jgi:hypothetical protein
VSLSDSDFGLGFGPTLQLVQRRHSIHVGEDALAKRLAAVRLGQRRSASELIDR